MESEFLQKESLFKGPNFEGYITLPTIVSKGRNVKARLEVHKLTDADVRLTYRGTLDFKSGSSGSVGDEQEDTLLLSPDVVNRSMPVILCQEEDVEGRHGATIGQLGEDLLFYINTRGIDEHEAKRLMVRAKLDSVAKLIPEPEIAERTRYYIREVV